MSQVAARAPGPNAESPESIGQKLRDALPAMRLHSLSLHDADGDVVWLSEGVLGPDEHSVVLEAMSSHTLEPNAPLSNRPLGDGRNALIIPARTSSGEVVGAAMVIVDSKQISSTLLLKLGTPGVRDALARLAARYQPASAPAAAMAVARPVVAPPAAPAPSSTLRATPAPAPATVRAAAAPPVAAPLEARAGDTLELSLVPDEPAASKLPENIPTLPPASPALRRPKPPAPAAATSIAKPVVAPPPGPPPAPVPTPPLAAAPAPMPMPMPMPVQTQVHEAKADLESDPDSTVIAPKPEMRDLALVVQQLLKLRSGGRTRRYEVLLRSRSDPARDAAPVTLVQAMTATDATSAIDRYVLTELVKWLGAHPQAWESEPSSFTVNLSTGTLRDRGFVRFASALFDEWKVTPGVVGFEIPERACIEAEPDVRAFVEGCEKLGCFLALDDFTMHSSAVPFLASPAVRIVKIDARLTMAAMKDKLSQAIVIAISQASKVLGVHCVAKRIESSMARQWLSAIGIDFAQGFALERPQTLDTLLRVPKASRKSTEPVAW